MDQWGGCKRVDGTSDPWGSRSTQVARRVGLIDASRDGWGKWQTDNGEGGD
jgi:hypothetical protein